MKNKEIGDISEEYYVANFAEDFEKLGKLLTPSISSQTTEDNKNTKKKYPRLTIERYGFDKEGHIIYIDLHDEKFGEAIFFDKGNRHHHGFYNNGDCEDF